MLEQGFELRSAVLRTPLHSFSIEIFSQGVSGTGSRRCICLNESGGNLLENPDILGAGVLPRSQASAYGVGPFCGPRKLRLDGDF